MKHRCIACDADDLLLFGSAGGETLVVEPSPGGKYVPVNGKLKIVVPDWQEAHPRGSKIRARDAVGLPRYALHADLCRKSFRPRPPSQRPTKKLEGRA